MAKTIALNDKTYDRLRKMADMSERSLGGEIRYLMNLAEDKE